MHAFLEFFIFVIQTLDRLMVYLRIVFPGARYMFDLQQQLKNQVPRNLSLWNCTSITFNGGASARER